MADLEFYKLSMTGEEADSGIRTGMEAGATSGVLLGDGNGGVTSARPGQDFGYPLLTGNGPPTGNTAANIGQHYFDMQATQAPYEYICVGLNANGFIWIVFGDTGDGFKISGYFASLEALETAINEGEVEAPTAGVSYGIGEAAPYDIYTWDGVSGDWVNNGPLGSSGGGSGVPPHGSEGQALVKYSDADYDAGWGQVGTLGIAPGAVTTPKIADNAVTAEKLAPGAVGVRQLATNVIPDALGYTPGMVNPNLLDNWYFVNPVNQRGQTSYSGAGYGIDRWALQSITSAALTLQSDFISFSFGLNDGLLQKFELAHLLEGAAYTISLLTAENELLKCTFNLTAGVNKFDLNEQWKCATSKDTGAGSWVVWLALNENNSTQTLNIIAAKLELGSQQTLAHQENGVWVLNEIPDYGEQLAKCQRYYIQIPSYTYMYGHVGGASSDVTIIFLTPVIMRKVPVLLAADTTVYIRYGGAYQTLLMNTSTMGMRQNQIFFTFKFTNPLSQAHVPVTGEILGSIDLSADL